MGDEQQAPTPEEHKDFFISYTEKDSTWAEWIAFELEAAHQETVSALFLYPSHSLFFFFRLRTPSTLFHESIK